MSCIQIRSSPPSAPPQPSAHDLKQRVIACLNRLADRDTLALAVSELDSIARNLSPESFSLFLNCLHSTDSSARSPVRKQCVSLLSLLSRSHGDSLTPHISKMVSTVLRRIRDPDSAVRAACAMAAADMSSSITRSPFSALFGPLIETLVQDRDANAQIGAAMCLQAAVEAAPEPEVEQLRKALPKMVKLLKSEGFKAKPALLGVIGSVIGAGGAGSKGVLDWLVPCVIEFLSREDWAARKAAAETLERLAMSEEELAPQYKKPCLTALESRRFDKVKIVRETMNRTLELWKEVQVDSQEVSVSPFQYKSSTDNGTILCFPSATKSSFNGVGFKAPRPKKVFSTMVVSPAPDSSSVTGKRDNTLKSDDRNSSTQVSSKLDEMERFNRELQTTQPKKGNVNVDQEAEKSGEQGSYRPRIKRALFSKTCDVKENKFGGLRSGARVVPCNDEENSDAATVRNVAEVIDENEKDIEDLSLIRKQITQIEKQQSNLLDLLQRFIGSSQSGINSLESRVHGLEMALNEISHNLALSSGRIPDRDHAGDTCCKLPGTEFLSPKFWRKTESCSSCSKSSSWSEMQPTKADYNTQKKDADADTHKPDNQIFQQESNNASGMKPPADFSRDMKGQQLGFYSNRVAANNFQDTGSLRFLYIDK